MTTVAGPYTLHGEKREALSVSYFGGGARLLLLLRRRGGGPACRLWKFSENYGPTTARRWTEGGEVCGCWLEESTEESPEES